MWLAVALAAIFSAPTRASEVSYKYADVDGSRLFYREAGDPRSQTILLLHGFPSSSHMFRDLIPDLATHFHVIAPDYPGMGNSQPPTATGKTSSFDAVADGLAKFVDKIGVTNAILYMTDLGGPVGMRLATRRPEWVRGIIIQNTPVSLDGWDPARLKAVAASAGPETSEKRAAAESRVVLATDVFLYRHGARNPEALNPDAWASDAFALARPEARRVMTDLQLDIQSNLSLYPWWQDYLRTHQPRTLVVWGDGDPIFAPRGADAIMDFVPNAEVHHYNTGHFALEEEHAEIARQIIRYFGSQAPQKR
jgi:pimeloyl-ACP methyl ester carboxylesterase